MPIWSWRRPSRAFMSSTAWSTEGSSGGNVRAIENDQVKYGGPRGSAGSIRRAGLGGDFVFSTCCEKRVFPVTVSKLLVALALPLWTSAPTATHNVARTHHTIVVL